MAYIEACVQAGFPRNPDYNGASQDGVGLAQVNQRRGFRSQASWEYLRRVAPKNRLIVRTKALAHRVLLEKDRAVGIEYHHDGIVKQVRVREEVILSGGALASPRLLMLSGIGPRDELSNAGVDLVHELPGVGQNLHEHPYLMQRWVSRGVPTFNKPRPGAILRDLVAFARDGGGILAMTMVQVQCMAKTDPSLPAPDLQLQFVPMAITRDVDENGMFNVQLAKQEGFLSSSTFLKPRARGSIGLRGTSPDAPPRISYQFLANPDDLRDVVKGLRAVQEVMAQPAMREITAGQFEPESGCRTDADWEKYVREYVTPSYHPVGTCKMGIDDLAVVDPELRVHGMRNLRVVDAGIMPTITTGNTNAPSMMIGERAAELIQASAR
jgi:choline dehydrogenase